MSVKLEDYLAPIGKVTIAAAFLEEVVIKWSALLSQQDHMLTHGQRLFRGLEKNLTFLETAATSRITPSEMPAISRMIAKARALKDQRNKSVHGVWAQMSNADTGALAAVVRSRYERDDTTGKAEWLIDAPTISELDTLASDIRKISLEIHDALARLWDNDPQIVIWRTTSGFT